MKKFIKAAVCDDLVQDRTYLRDQLAKYFFDRDMDYKIEEYSCGENLVAEYEDERADYDLVLLDIFMGAMSGIKAAHRIRMKDKSVKIAFTTNSPDYAIEGYGVKAEAYLLKPISMQELAELMDRVMKEEMEERRRRILIKSGSRQFNLYHREILYIESMKRELMFYTADGGCYKTYGKLDDVERELDNAAFLRCHQSYLVNMHFIRSAGDGFAMCTGASLPIRKREQRAIKEKYFEYMLEASLRE